MMESEEVCGDSSNCNNEGESGGEDDELAVLPRHTKVIVTGNNRTKSVLVGLQGVVKKAVGLGGWHWLGDSIQVIATLVTDEYEVGLDSTVGTDTIIASETRNLGYMSPPLQNVSSTSINGTFEGHPLLSTKQSSDAQLAYVLKNGVEVKLQRNALSVLEHPTGNEEDFDNDHDSSSSSEQGGVKENVFASSLGFQRPCKPRFKFPKSYVPSTSIKSIYRDSYQDFQPIYKPKPRVKLGKLGTSTLRRYCRHFNLVSSCPNPTREQLIRVVQRHFSSQLTQLDEATVISEFVNAARRRKSTELSRNRT